MSTKKLLLLMTLFVGLISWTAKADITKTVGTIGGNYATLKAAFDDINANVGGVFSGVITLQIVDNTTETAIAQIKATNTNWTALNIYPTVTGKTIAGDMSGDLIQLDSTTNVTIDGRLNATGTTRDLTITNTGGTDLTKPSTINLTHSASNNTIKYCIIKGSGTSYVGTINFAVATKVNGNANNMISNNLITSASEANRSYISVFSWNDPAKGFVTTNNSVINNEFSNYWNLTKGGNAVYLGTGNSAWTISGNSFYETTSFAGGTANKNFNAIYLNNTGTGFLVSDNWIGGTAAQCAGTALTKTNGGDNGFTAIYLKVGKTPASIVQNNSIKNINWSNSASAMWTGIEIWSQVINVIGNTVGATTGTGSIVYTGGGTGAATINGISFCDSISGSCSNNKIGSITTNSIQTTFYGIYNVSTGISTINNNIIGSLKTANSINASSTDTRKPHSLIGIKNYGVAGTNTVSGNTIANITNAANSSSTVRGILSNRSANNVNGNFIYNLNSPNSTNTAKAQMVGILIEGYDDTATSTYSNNIITLGGAYACDLMGIYNWSTKTNTSTTNVYFNTIYINGGTQTPNPNTKSYCVRLDGTTVYNMNVKNNIMVSTRATTGSTSLHYGFFGAAPLGSLTCDNNDYSVSGEASVLGYYGSDMTALPIVSGQDPNSKAIDPGFSYIGATNPLATDYAISATTLKADATTGILTDYLGKTRPAIPTMGALDPNGIAGINDTKMQLAYQLAHTTTGILASFENEAVIELYSISGQMIEKTKATGSYSRNLNKGVYIIRINGNASKFIM